MPAAGHSGFDRRSFAPGETKMPGSPEILHLVVNLGTVAMLCIEGSYVPQIVRLFRLKHAEDVSVLFPALNLFGRGLAVVYSFTQNQPVFVVGFMLGMVLRGILLSQVVYYRWQQRRPRRSLRVTESMGETGAMTGAAPGLS
jgi:lipid-A-disaccharide synthase-like uncharacterized protein